MPSPSTARSPLPPLPAYTLCTLSGALTFMAFPTFDLWPLAYIALVPLLIATEACHPGPAFRRGLWMGTLTNLGGFYWITHLLQRFAEMPWWLAAGCCVVLSTIQGVRFALWTWALQHIHRWRPRWPRWVMALIVFLALEFAFPLVFPWHLGNSQYRAHAMIQIADLVGVLGISAVVMLVNVAFMEWWMWMRRRRSSDPTRSLPWRVSLSTLVVVAATLGYGVVQLDRHDAAMATADTLRVGLVEGNVDVDTKETLHALDAQLQVHQRLSAALADEGAALIVWPESSFHSVWIWGTTESLEDPLSLMMASVFADRARPLIAPAARGLEVGFGEPSLVRAKTRHRVFVRALNQAVARLGVAQLGVAPIPINEVDFCAADSKAWIRCPFFRLVPDGLRYMLPSEDRDGGFPWAQRSVQRGHRVPVLFGTLTVQAKGDVDMPYHKLLQAPRRTRDLYNAVMLLDAQGRVRGQYRKNHLLLFGEHVPFLGAFPWIYKILPNAGALTPGTSPGVLELDGVRLGVSICYEDILAGFIRQQGRRGSQILINVTNDAWFGPTSEPHLHLALATLRSVEHRQWLVRATNTGISAFVDANGRIVQQTSLERAETLIADVPVMSGEPTLYARVGDVLGWLAVMSSITFWILAWWRGRAQQETS